MKKNEKKGHDGPIRGRFKREFVEVYCPICKQSKIIALPDEPMPDCEYCKRPMVIREVLTEGKY